MKERETVLIVGGGGREHAIGWKIKKDNPDVELFFAPGNGGTADIGTNLDIDSNDIDRLCSTVKDKKIDYTIVCPERPLVNGIVDAFAQDGLEIFGHTQKAAVLEGDKGKAIEFMMRHKIPHPPSRIFTDPKAAEAFVQNIPWPKIVIKAAGIAEGKGVDLPDTLEEAIDSIRKMMIDRKFGEAGEKIVIQKRLKGQEMSVIGFVSNQVGLLVPARDYKRAYDGDKGPNTGGMGAYAPNEFATSVLMDTTYKTIIYPTFSGAKEEGIPANGIVYFGLMITEDGPQVIEYNMRFGDPETQVQLRLLESNLLESMRACTRGELEERHYRSSNKAAVGVVVASNGYPGKYEIGKEIRGLDQNLPEGIVVFHGGTLRTPDKKLVSNGGRAFTITNVGRTKEEAAQGIYEIMKDLKIEMDDSFKRKDVAA